MDLFQNNIGSTLFLMLIIQEYSLCVDMSSFDSYDFLLTSLGEASYSPDGSSFTIQCKDLPMRKLAVFFPSYFMVVSKIQNYHTSYETDLSDEVNHPCYEVINILFLHGGKTYFSPTKME